MGMWKRGTGRNTGPEDTEESAWVSGGRPCTGKAPRTNYFAEELQALVVQIRLLANCTRPSLGGFSGTPTSHTLPRVETPGAGVRPAGVSTSVGFARCLDTIVRYLEEEGVGETEVSNGKKAAGDAKEYLVLERAAGTTHSPE
ncbi:uncharacterized protein [Triticum aestivum]|uniref:uncharacterized protein n=1 Tax=Triticum aestivum TaxID=4565 RepID=UPI001D0305CB|nr:uncharacterized protein LOC123163634 [Triticum aestivum]